MHHFSSALRGGSRGGRQLQFAWVRAVAAALLAGAALFATATFAQFQFTLRKIALTNPIELCKPEFIRRIAGAPVPDSPLIPRPVHVIYYDGPVDDLLGMNLILALLSFKQLDQNTIQNELQAMLYSHKHRVKGRLNVKSCSIYSYSERQHLSLPHQDLISSGLDYLSFSLFRVYARYPTPRISEHLGLPRTGQPSPGKAQAGDRTPPRQAKQTKPNRTADGTPKKAVSPGTKTPATVATPQPSTPAADPTVANDPAAASSNPIPEKDTTIAALPPNAPDVVGPPPEVQRKSLKRYPRPSYKEGAKPLTLETLRRTLAGVKRALFAVEEIQCGEEGNWLVGYAGQLERVPGDVPGEDVEVLLTQRHALNNYPDERVTTLAALRKTHGDASLECDAGRRECSSPALPNENYADYRRELPTSRTSRTGAVSDRPRYSCRPDKGICISQEREHWRCNLDGNCLSYDPTRWWCAWRQEFCFSRVKFGDWASPIKQNDVIRLKLDGSEPELVYDMSDGFLRIAQDALTRVCGPGETKLWKASWVGQK